MARAHLYRVLLNTNGTPITGASVSVRDTSDVLLSDTLYTSEAGGGTQANPFTSATGVIDLYLVNPKRVHLQFTPPGGSPTTVVVDVDPSADVIPSSTFDPSTITAASSSFLTSLNTSVTNNTSDITSLKNSRTTDESNISSLQSTVSGHTTSIGNNTSAITSLQTSRTTDETNIANLQTAVGSMTGLASTTPAQSGTTGTVGTSTTVARSDHRHQSQFQIEATTLPLRDGNNGSIALAKTKGGVGSVGTVSDSGHAHPRWYPHPSDFALLAWTDPPRYINGNGSAIGSGILQLAMIQVPEAITIGHVNLAVSTANSGPVAGQSFIGIYNSSGTLIGLTTDQGSAAFSNVGARSAAVSVQSGQSLSIAAGDVIYVGVLSNATTGPALYRVAGTLTAQYGLSGATNIYAQSGSGLTALPTSVTLSSTTQITGFWAAVST